MATFARSKRAVARVIRHRACPSEGVSHQKSSPLATASIRVSEAPDLRSATLAVPTVGVSLQAVERALIAFALERHAGNRTHAARFLHLSRSALLYRMRKYRLHIPPIRSDTPGSKDKPL